MYLNLNRWERDVLKANLKKLAKAKVIRNKYESVKDYSDQYILENFFNIENNLFSSYNFCDLEFSLLSDEFTRIRLLLSKVDCTYSNLIREELQKVTTIEELLEKWKYFSSKYITRKIFNVEYTFLTKSYLSGLRIENLILIRLLELCGFSDAVKMSIYQVMTAEEFNYSCFDMEYTDEFLADELDVSIYDSMGVIESIFDHFNINFFSVEGLGIAYANSDLSDEDYLKVDFGTIDDRSNIKKMFALENSNCYSYYDLPNVNQSENDLFNDMCNFYEDNGLSRNMFLAIDTHFSKNELSKLEEFLSVNNSVYSNYEHEDAIYDDGEFTKIELFETNERLGLSPLFLITLILILNKNKQINK